jgi:uncharacterized membrane protein YgdD (TMEM256/DUF423 family)
MKKLNPGTAGWISVAAVVIAADVLDARTMSEVFRETARHPVGGPVMLIGWAILTAHLFGTLPQKYDPIHNAAEFVRRERNLSV